jgi:uncharacterized glyoxalase superfamily protein PhnB
MAQETAVKTQTIFPFLRYSDAPAAIDWLVQTFGFEKQMVVPGENGVIAHAQLSIGPSVVMLGSARGRAGGERPDDPQAVSHGIYVFVDDIDEHYRRAREAGAEIVGELSDTDYGSREYAALDPEGYYWGFGTYNPATH